MSRDIKKEVVEIFKVILVIMAVVLLYAVVGCPFRFFLGVACPGCGMTRAFISLLHLDIRSATMFHPLWPLVVLVIVLYIVSLILRKIKKMTISTNIRNIYIILIAFIFVLVYTIRILYKDSVVMPDIKSGFLYKIIKYFIMMR